MASQVPGESTRIDSNGGLTERGAEILRTADRLFVTRGYTATTMNDLAEATGILPGSLYHHFPSKESVAVALLEAFNDDVHALPSTLRGAGLLDHSPEARLRELSKALAVIGSRHPAAVRLRGIMPPSSASERFQRAVDYRPTGMYRLWHQAASELSELPGVTATDPTLLAFGLQSLSITASAHADGSTSMEEVADLNCDLLLYGICRDTRPDSEFDRAPSLAAVRRAVKQWHRPAFEGDQTRIDILAAARQIFASRGYANTTIRDIAHLSGVHMGTIYRRFDSMQDIYTEIIEGFSRHLHDTMMAALTSAPDDIPATIDAAAFAIAQTNRMFREETTIMSEAWIREAPDETVTHQAFIARVDERLTHLTELIVKGQNEGVVTCELPAPVISRKLRQILWVRYHQRDRASARRIQYFARNHLLRGVMERPAGTGN